jgi:hypothetical protein
LDELNNLISQEKLYHAFPLQRTRNHVTSRNPDSCWLGTIHIDIAFSKRLENEVRFTDFIPLCIYFCLPNRDIQLFIYRSGKQNFLPGKQRRFSAINIYILWLGKKRHVACFRSYNFSATNVTLDPNVAVLRLPWMQCSERDGAEQQCN